MVGEFLAERDPIEVAKVLRSYLLFFRVSIFRHSDFFISLCSKVIQHVTGKTQAARKLLFNMQSAAKFM